MRSKVAILLATALAVLAGYAGTRVLTAPPADAGGTAAPVPAASPSVPIDPPPVLVDDPDSPALEAGLPMRRSRLGRGPFAVTVPTPRGWERTDSAPLESKWAPPGSPSFTYLLRVEDVRGEQQTVEQMLEDRIEELDEVVERFVVLRRADDALEFEYLSDGHRRFGVLRWVDLTGSGRAQLEVATTGRERDLTGLRWLVDEVAAGASS